MSLASHPLRSLLTALSVTFGTAVLFVLLGYATGMPQATEQALHRMGSTEFVVEARWRGGGRRGRPVQIRYADLPVIRDACPSIAAIAPGYRPVFGAPAYISDRSWPWVSLHGVGYEYRDVVDLRILDGRWFTHEEELLAEELALLNVPLAEGLFEGRSPIGESIDFQGRRFRIIGVFESAATFSFGLYVPYPTAMEMGETGGRYVSFLAFEPRRSDLAKEAVAEMRAALATLYAFDPEDTRALEVKENTGFIERVRTVSLGLQWLVLTIASLALVLGCLGAANVVGIAVSERTAELGLRKALGATPSRLRAEVLAETLVLCLGGGLAGVMLGALTIALLGELVLSDQAKLVPSSDPALLFGALGVLVVTATLAGLPAANRAARLDPVAALREE